MANEARFTTDPRNTDCGTEDPEAYLRHVAEFEAHLRPAGIIEQTFAAEIASAAWRLHRCRLAEAAAAADDAGQKSFDRARSSALKVMCKAMAELRRLQTERQIRAEICPANSDLSAPGFAATKEIISARNARERGRLLAEKSAGVHPASPAIHNDVSITPPASPELGSFCKMPAKTRIVGRNAPCPCNSGQKYKRCCGPNTPPILNKAA